MKKTSGFRFGSRFNKLCDRKNTERLVLEGNKFIQELKTLRNEAWGLNLLKKLLSSILAKIACHHKSGHQNAGHLKVPVIEQRKNIIFI